VSRAKSHIGSTRIFYGALVVVLVVCLISTSWQWYKAEKRFRHGLMDIYGEILDFSVPIEPEYVGQYLRIHFPIQRIKPVTACLGDERTKIYIGEFPDRPPVFVTGVE
jgi:hypothetical protein